MFTSKRTLLEYPPNAFHKRGNYVTCSSACTRHWFEGMVEMYKLNRHPLQQTITSQISAFPLSFSFFSLFSFQSSLPLLPLPKNKQQLKHLCLGGGDLFFFLFFYFSFIPTKQQKLKQKKVKNKAKRNTQHAKLKS